MSSSLSSNTVSHSPPMSEHFTCTVNQMRTPPISCSAGRRYGRARCYPAVKRSVRVRRIVDGRTEPNPSGSYSLPDRSVVPVVGHLLSTVLTDARSAVPLEFGSIAVRTLVGMLFRDHTPAFSQWHIKLAPTCEICGFTRPTATPRSRCLRGACWPWPAGPRCGRRSAGTRRR